MRLWSILILLMAASANATADDRVRGERGVVIDITDSGGLIVETETGERLNVRVAAIRQPDIDEPLHAAANTALVDAAGAAAVSLSYDGEHRRDRYDRAIAYVDMEGGGDLSARLVESGWAIVYSTRDARADIEALLALEGEARQHGRGLWSDPAFQVRTADPNGLALWLDSVQIVEGRVISTAQTRERIYLNFGFDYRSDFTVSVDNEAFERFAAAGIDLLDLQDVTVRVRGWLHRRNGPMIAIDHPERLEILGP